HAWILEKQTPLGDILVRRGVLDRDDRDDLDRLVARHVQRHGDPRASLAALRVEPAIRQALESLPDPHLAMPYQAMGEHGTSSVNGVGWKPTPLTCASPHLQSVNALAPARARIGDTGCLDKSVALHHLPSTSRTPCRGQGIPCDHRTGVQK